MGVYCMFVIGKLLGGCCCGWWSGIEGDLSYVVGFGVKWCDDVWIGWIWVFLCVLWWFGFVIDVCDYVVCMGGRGKLYWWYGSWRRWLFG